MFTSSVAPVSLFAMDESKVFIITIILSLGLNRSCVCSVEDKITDGELGAALFGFGAGLDALQVRTADARIYGGEVLQEGFQIALEVLDRATLRVERVHSLDVVGCVASLVEVEGMATWGGVGSHGASGIAFGE